MQPLSKNKYPLIDKLLERIKKGKDSMCKYYKIIYITK